MMIPDIETAYLGTGSSSLTVSQRTFRQHGDLNAVTVNTPAACTALYSKIYKYMICVYICIYIYMHAHMYIYTYIHIYVYTYIHIYIYRRYIARYINM